MVVARLPIWVGVAAAVLVSAIARPAHADEWNDKTILRFSAPVMVPGATLGAGEYVFQIADTRGDRNLIQIFNNENHQLITTTEAVPVKRAKTTEDVVIRLQPTEAGAPVAISAWFYPGSLYGHQFVYPESQARDIAARTKTLVLSRDTKNGAGAGSIHIIDAQGRSQDWRPDAAVMAEWNTWRGSHPSAAATATGEQTPKKSDVAVVRSERTGMQVKVDDLEDNPSKYIGQRVSVDAVVEKVLGPRLFTIDEPNWGDLEGEIMVTMTAPFAALIKEDDRVTIEGTVRPFLAANVEHEWGWLGITHETELKIARKPVLVADRVIGGNDKRSLIIDANAAPRPVGTAGSAAGADISSVGVIANGTESLVGRQVHLSNVTIDMAGVNGGFLLRSGADRVFVLPALPVVGPIAGGNTVMVDGYVMRMPHHMAEQLDAPAVNRDIYIYAFNVRP